jgi:hypothetical protein
MRHTPSAFAHPVFSRRTALQAGASAILGLGVGELAALRAAPSADASAPRHASAGSVIYIFLSGGLAQQDSFDLKPDAPENVRGEFRPIPTATPGLRICEHLPRLAARSHLWALCRSLTHPSNDHSRGHLIMLTGRSDLPPGFNANAPMPSDWPALAAVAGAVTRPRNNLPPAVVLPERLVHNSGRVIPGQFAGVMGRPRDPWFFEMSGFEPKAYGAYPEYEFDHQERPFKPTRREFVLPDLTLPQGVDAARLDGRLDLLRHIDDQRRALEQGADGMARHRQNALSLLTDPKVRRAFDVRQAPARVIERYGNNAFGWSLLVAARLVEAGVNLVQVNLGNNETWDTHGNAFPHLRDHLFPPTDRALSALLDDLNDRGLLGRTLVVMAGEFGRTPKVFGLPQFYKLPGRDHWGAVQTVFFAGGGVRGGTVVGSSDKNGGFPASDPQTPENMAATIYQALGLPTTTAWYDFQDRPHHIYQGEPIRGLLS